MTADVIEAFLQKDCYPKVCAPEQRCDVLGTFAALCMQELPTGMMLYSRKDAKGRLKEVNKQVPV